MERFIRVPPSHSLSNPLSFTAPNSPFDSPLYFSLYTSSSLHTSSSLLFFSQYLFLSPLLLSMPVSLSIPHPLPLPLPLSTDERDAMKELRSEISSVIKTLAQEYVEQFPSPVTVPAPSSGKKASSAGETI